ncbi:hypothetical protein J6590_008307 [Homalodisca vitripennis]|nr:hypothetical protein J6590_008307 [Homalodisca vitripennis]
MYSSNARSSAASIGPGRTPVANIYHGNYSTHQSINPTGLGYKSCLHGTRSKLSCHYGQLRALHELAVRGKKGTGVSPAITTLINPRDAGFSLGHAAQLLDNNVNRHVFYPVPQRESIKSKI